MQLSKEKGGLALSIQTVMANTKLIDNLKD